MSVNIKQKGSLLPYLMTSVVLCLLVGFTANFLLSHYFQDYDWWIVALIITGPLIGFLVLGDLFGLLNHFVRKNILKIKYFCPCCGYRSLEENSLGSSEICDVCGWKQDYLQFLYKNREEGLNTMTFIEYQQRFLTGHEEAENKIELDRDPGWLASSDQ